MANRKVILVIMDGWGIGRDKRSDVIQNASVPFVKSLYTSYPNTTLTTCGEAVGLPDGQMGNSEVGHLNLGAGRIVYQELQRINVAVRDGSLGTNETFLNTLAYAKNNGKALHLLGLVSDGGVHSHINHLLALVDLCKHNSIREVYIHAFTDGRDTDPRSGLGYIQTLQQHLKDSPVKIASVSGRYYAMDRDKRWERVQLAYNALVNGIGESGTNPLDAISAAYANNITDEFIKPTIMVNQSGEPIGLIKDGDAAICFNFRTDRCREITQVLTQEDMPEYGMKKLQLYYTTMTEYDKTYRDVKVIFETDNLNNTLGEVLQNHHKKQIRIAETEKYPHVTFFFNGGRETPFPDEQRIMIQSPRVATYDLQPEMSAYELTDAIIPEIEHETADFICLNYANADMVGHTGVWDAVKKAVETVDACVNRLVTTALKHGYITFLTADHGNADYMLNDDGSPNTAHSLNPVPFFVISNDWKGTLKPGKLGDIAPTILHMMNLPIPEEMSGEVLTDS